MTPTFNLQRRLLGLGGTAVSFESSLDLTDIFGNRPLRTGTELPCQPRLLRRGETNCPHYNAAHYINNHVTQNLNLFEQGAGNPEWVDTMDVLAETSLCRRVWTGWVLLGDTWLPHSWIVSYSPSNLMDWSNIIETLDIQPLHYFGFELCGLPGIRFLRLFSSTTTLIQESV